MNFDKEYFLQQSKKIGDFPIFDTNNEHIRLPKQIDMCIALGGVEYRGFDSNTSY